VTTVVTAGEVAGPGAGPTTWTLAAYAVTMGIVIGVAASMWGVPLPVSDNLPILLDVQQTSFRDGLATALGDEGRLRPLFWVQYKVLFALSTLSGGNYYLAFQGFHVAMFAATVLLSVAALRVRTVHQFVGASVAVTVLLGLHTFGNLVRELPITVITCCALAMVLAFAERAARWRDVLAVVNLAIAMFFVEIGLVVWVIHVAAYMCGRRGVSRRAIGALTATCAAYFVLRFMVLPAGAPPVFPRDTGIGFSSLDEAQLRDEYAGRRYLVYLYNVAASITSVLFSEPRQGIFQFTRRVLEGETLPWMWLNVLSSLVTTGCLVWFLIRSRMNLRLSMLDRDQAMVVVAAGVLVANAVISYPYSRDVVMSPAGLAYALAAGATTSGLLQRAATMPGIGRGVLVCVLLAASIGWSLRTIGLTYSLRRTAFVNRNDWASVEEWLEQSGRLPSGGAGLALVQQLKRESLAFRVPNPGLSQPSAEKYFGTGVY
jgi:hypothetical protein